MVKRITEFCRKLKITKSMALKFNQELNNERRKKIIYVVTPNRKIAIAKKKKRFASKPHELNAVFLESVVPTGVFTYTICPNLPNSTSFDRWLVYCTRNEFDFGRSPSESPRDRRRTCSSRRTAGGSGFGGEKN